MNDAPDKKAADIPDEALLRVVAIANDEVGRWAFLGDLTDSLDAFPQKVVQAKARRLVKRGVLDGCACGCRGDFELTTAGRRLLGLAVEEGT